MSKQNNIHILNLATYEKPEIVEQRNKDWVEYGKKNDYYDWLIGRYKNSTTNNAIINNVSRLIYGRGLHALDASRKPNDYAMMKAMISPKVLRGVSLNFKMLGAGFFQVLYNKQHTKIVKVDYLPTRLIRAGKCNEEGEIDTWWYSENWDDVRNNPPRPIPAYGTSKEAIELDVVRFDSVDMKYYTDVDYHGCLPYCVLEEEIADYQINDVQNGFSGTKVVNFNNGVPDEEAQRQISKQVKGQLTGAKGEKTVIAFNANAESATTVTDIPLNDAPEHYQYLSTECQAKILNGHTVISPMLVGITIDNNGFSSNADEIEIATKVFYNQAIVPFQDAILERIEEYLMFNGCSLDLYFKRLNLMDSIEEKQQAKEEAELKMNSDFDSIIAEFGEDESEDWELIDEREVDYDAETELDAQVQEWENELKQDNKTKLQKIWELATGTASPNKPSDQDKEIDGFYFRVRYKYTGNPSPERGFCEAMMRAAKIYRKEDIDKMSNKIVNAGFGEFGANTYDIFKFKGGARCHHKWVRRTYVSASKTASIGSPKTNQISTNKARKFGYNPVNSKEVAMKPNDMKYKGFSPNNNNRPIDAQ